MQLEVAQGGGGEVVMSQIPPTKSFLGTKFILEPISIKKKQKNLILGTLRAKIQDGIRFQAKNQNKPNILKTSKKIVLLITYSRKQIKFLNFFFKKSAKSDKWCEFQSPRKFKKRVASRKIGSKIIENCKKNRFLTKNFYHNRFFCLKSKYLGVWEFFLNEENYL